MSGGGVVLADQIGQSRPIMALAALASQARISPSNQTMQIWFLAKHRNGIDRFCRVETGAFPGLGLGIFHRPAGSRLLCRILAGFGLGNALLDYESAQNFNR